MILFLVIQTFFYLLLISSQRKTYFIFFRCQTRDVNLQLVVPMHLLSGENIHN